MHPNYVRDDCANRVVCHASIETIDGSCGGARPNDSGRTCARKMMRPNPPARDWI